MISKSKINVRYAETDKMGIVHHSVYPIWFEVARTDFGKEAGFRYADLEEKGIYTPLVELGVKYYKPADYDDELEIRTRISKLTPARVEFTYEVYNVKTNEFLSEGFTTHALVGSNFRPMNMKKIHPDVWELMLASVEE